MNKKVWNALWLVLSLTLIAALVFVQQDKERQRDMTRGFDVLSHPRKWLSGLSLKVLNIHDEEEKKLGETIKKEYLNKHFSKAPKRVLELFQVILPYTQRELEYEIFYVEDMAMLNAFAYPGGKIVLTQGLVYKLSDEELLSVLAHETGHVELGHCLDRVKYQVATERIDAEVTGQVLDFLQYLSGAVAYKRSQEIEADDYSAALLKHLGISLKYQASAFGKLLASGQEQSPDFNEERLLIEDYFQTHPDLVARIDKAQRRSKSER